jgi:hypothetical protein
MDFKKKKPKGRFGHLVREIDKKSRVIFTEQAEHPAAEKNPIVYQYGGTTWMKAGIDEGGGKKSSAAGAIDLGALGDGDGFINLGDTPDVYEANKLLRINADATRIEFITESDINHNNLGNYEESRHRDMNYDDDIKAYLIND